MHLRERLLAVTVTATVTAMLALTGSAASPASAGTHATLRLASASGAPGAPVDLSGRIPSDVRVRVELQRLDADTYVTLAATTTDMQGDFTFSTRVPDDRATASFRVSWPTGVTPTRTVVTGTTTRLTQDPDPTKEEIDRIGAQLPSISGDGRFVAYSTRASRSKAVVFVWDRNSGATSRVSPRGAPASASPSVSDDGRFVAYTERPPYYQHRTGDVVVVDRALRTSMRVTSDNAGSSSPSISADGRFVAFVSRSPSLVAHDTNHHLDVFRWDRLTGKTRRITDGHDSSFAPQISANGRWVCFASAANNLVPRDTNGHTDVFLWDSRTGHVRRVTRGNSEGWSPSVSADGTYVAFIASDTNPEHPSSQMRDVYLWSRATGRTTRVTTITENTDSPVVSDDGNHVVYRSHATTLVPADANYRQADVFLWDRQTRTTTRLVNDLNCLSAAVSADGSHVAFDMGDLDIIHGPEDVYLWDRAS